MEPIVIGGAQLAEALQYSATLGLPRLLEQLRKLQARDHSPPYDSWQIMVCTGSQDGLLKAFEMLLNRGDSLLVENPTYSGALAGLRPLGINLVPLECDNEGIVPSSLDTCLSSWSSPSPRPRVLYTIPTGQNPSGATASNQRRDELYALACKHDLIIIEDDPYWNLTLLTDKEKAGESNGSVLSAGIRVGFVTAPAPVLDRLQLHQQAACLHADGLAQTLVASLLERWGADGWNNHVRHVRTHYTKQAEAFQRAAERHLKGVCTWSPPTAGMFAWLEVIGVPDTRAMVKRAAENKVLLVPGAAFNPKSEAEKVPFLRASYSIASEEQMDEALRRLAECCREERKNI